MGQKGNPVNLMGQRNQQQDSRNGRVRTQLVHGPVGLFLGGFLGKHHLPGLDAQAGGGFQQAALINLGRRIIAHQKGGQGHLPALELFLEFPADFGSHWLAGHDDRFTHTNFSLFHRKRACTGYTPSVLLQDRKAPFGDLS